METRHCKERMRVYIKLACGPYLFNYVLGEGMLEKFNYFTVINGM